MKHEKTKEFQQKPSKHSSNSSEDVFGSKRTIVIIEDCQKHRGRPITHRPEQSNSLNSQNKTIEKN